MKEQHFLGTRNECLLPCPSWKRKNWRKLIKNTNIERFTLECQLCSASDSNVYMVEDNLHVGLESLLRRSWFWEVFVKSKQFSSSEQSRQHHCKLTGSRLCFSQVLGWGCGKERANGLFVQDKWWTVATVVVPLGLNARRRDIWHRYQLPPLWTPCKGISCSTFAAEKFIKFKHNDKIKGFWPRCLLYKNC